MRPSGEVLLERLLKRVESEQRAFDAYRELAHALKGAQVADHYSKLAQSLHPELPPELRHLAWLDLSTDVGQEYWAAMELMGEYAAANHACIHRHVAAHLGAEVLLDLENHHNFAWREMHDGEELIVHRKGATPAGEGTLGIIPGSMASPTYIVRGRGEPDSLDSAAHGAGRRMSRTKAKATYSWSEVRPYLERRGGAQRAEPSETGGAETWSA